MNDNLSTYLLNTVIKYTSTYLWYGMNRFMLIKDHENYDILKYILIYFPPINLYNLININVTIITSKTRYAE